MSQRRVNETSLTATADALRAKLGTSDPITWVENEGFKEAVESIQTDSGGADVSGVTATETEVLENAIFVDAHGEYKEGTIPRNGDTSATFDGIETKSVEIPAGYTTGGKVELDGTIDNAVEAAKTSLANKGVDVPTATDVRGLAGLIDSIPEAGDGGELQELDVTPSHEVQEFIPAEGVAGYKKVTVKPVPRLPFAAVSVTGSEFVQTHALYGGTWGARLPLLPADVLADYPYAWIFWSDTNNRYQLYFSTAVWYMVDKLSSGRVITPSLREDNPVYVCASPYDSWEWEKNIRWNSVKIGSYASGSILWSNFDMPKDSATSTSIFNYASEPGLTV